MDHQVTGIKHIGLGEVVTTTKAQVRAGELVALAVRGTCDWTAMAVRRPQLATWFLLLMLVEYVALAAVLRRGGWGRRSSP